MTDEPTRTFWWRLVRLQPFGSDGSWRFEHPYLYVTLILIGLPLGITLANLTEGSVRVPWALVAVIWLAWLVVLRLAPRIDRRLMREDDRQDAA